MAYSRSILSPETAGKYAEVVRLRVGGSTFGEIAQTIGYSSRQGAHEAYKAAMKLAIREPSEDLRQLEAIRLENLWRIGCAQMYESEEAMLRGDPERDLSPGEWQIVSRTLLSVSTQKRALLGLDAPKQSWEEYQRSITGVEPSSGEDVREKLERLLDQRLLEEIAVEVAGEVNAEQERCKRVSHLPDEYFSAYS